MHSYSHTSWLQRGQLISRCKNPLLRQHLTHTGSLTRRLQKQSLGDFQVEVLHERIAMPRLDETRALNLPPRSYAIIREVMLWGKQQEWVYARSILPLTSLAGKNRRLAHLGNKPLGAALFADPQLQRQPLQFSYISNETQAQALHPRLLSSGGFDKPSASKARVQKKQNGTWGRRSLFQLRNKPILVAEYFLVKSYTDD